MRMKASVRALLGAAVTAGTVLTGTPAHAATIVCHVVRPTYLSGGKVVLRIGSDHPDPHRVHAFRVGYSNDTGSFGRTYSPVGPNLTVNHGGDRVVWVDGWQAGTKCAGVRG